jgi:hypothetical protein
MVKVNMALAWWTRNYLFLADVAFSSDFTEPLAVAQRMRDGAEMKSFARAQLSKANLEKL